MLVNSTESIMCLIDLQQRLIPAMHGAEAMVENAFRLAAASALLDLPVVVTEQYPKGLGHTVERLQPFADGAVAKTSFDISGLAQIERTMTAGRTSAVLAGCEAHVCVLQSAVGLAERGWKVFVVADAIASRQPASHALSLDRLRYSGIEIVSTEMVLFEFLRDSTHPHFRSLQKLIA